MLGAIACFALGSALGGASKSMTMLIVARTLQGAGSGGINSLTQIILSDLVTLEERGKYNGLFGMTWAISGGLGPVIGGALARHTIWRWLFYLNLPLSGICLGLILIFLQVPTPGGTVVEKLKRIDWIGNVLVISATTGLAIALSWGGVVYPWTSARVLAPLCISAALLVAWLVYESYFAAIPAIPLVANRTTFSGYIQIGLSAYIISNLVYYLPVYYRACKDASPIGSGVDLLGLSFSTAPVSIITGVSIAVTKRYRPQIWMSWCLTLIGLGLISTIDENTSRAKSIGFQILAGTGIGIMYSAAYFPVLAPLPVTQNAYALSGYVFIRTLFQVWGVTIGGAILQNELQNNLPQSILSSPLLLPGESVAYTIIPLIPSLPQPEKDAVRHAFAQSLIVLWRVLIAISGVGLLISSLMKPVPLHAREDENWAMAEKTKTEDTSATSSESSLAA
ncbi:hypothetical protein EIP91_010177 [Steccherinum ochraceum]|uniref:Major facilitator superfamily (MFS) profile domain-containing protein n=1 Tax=Steccherinum ochraceum TaxID=92696 RepID=A0A4R0RM38_9APHY|nr:hypothetical protein EIP91_010177 [Steccherinum ochraceum]